MSTVPAYMSEHHSSVWHPQELEDSIESPGIGILDSCKTPFT